MKKHIGTTNPEHLQSAIGALDITLTAEDIKRIEAAIPADKVSGKGSHNFRFTKFGDWFFVDEMPGNGYNDLRLLSTTMDLHFVVE